MTLYDLDPSMLYTYVVWTNRQRESDARRSGYEPLALLYIDLLGCSTCPV